MRFSPSLLTTKIAHSTVESDHFLRKLQRHHDDDTWDPNGTVAVEGNSVSPEEEVTAASEEETEEVVLEDEMQARKKDKANEENSGKKVKKEVKMKDAEELAAISKSIVPQKKKKINTEPSTTTGTVTKNDTKNLSKETLKSATNKDTKDNAPIEQRPKEADTTQQPPKNAHSSNGRSWPKFDPLEVWKNKINGSSNGTEEKTKINSESAAINPKNDELKQAQNMSEQDKSNTPNNSVPDIGIQQKQQQKASAETSTYDCSSLWGDDKDATFYEKVQCVTFGSFDKHPAGGLTFLLVLFFVSYCVCRIQHSRKYYNDYHHKYNKSRGEYSALSTYDELLEGNFNDELSSYCNNSSDDESVGTILSNWSGSNNNATGKRPQTLVEMPKLKGSNCKKKSSVYDDNFLDLEEVNG